MAKQLTVDDARQSLSAHVAEKGAEIFAKYGPVIGWKELQLILQDRACVRYPCKIAFDATPLLAGEVAVPVPQGEKPEDGFAIHVHPLWMMELERAVWLVLYQLVVVNYGVFASADDAEIFGSAALGISRAAYYLGMCEMADQIACTPDC